MDRVIKLSPWQEQVFFDDHRFKVVCAGRRTGKSVLARLILINWATKNTGKYWIVSPTYKQSKQIHWRELQEEIPPSWQRAKNEVELSMQIDNGSILELRGAENPDTLRGVKLRGLIVDEIASIRNWNWLWKEVLRPTLTDYEAPAIFISTPKGMNHFYELHSTKSKQYKSWTFTSYDNPYIPKGEIDQAREEMSEDTFAQEYLAEFRTAVGLAHRPFDRQKHVLEPFDVPSEWYRFRGFDYGTAHPTSSVRIAVNPQGDMFVERTYNQNQKHIEEHANMIKGQDYPHTYPAWGDPSGAQWMLEFQKYGLAIQPAKKEMGQGAKSWVEFCVDRVNQYLQPRPGHTVYYPGGELHDSPKLFILDTPDNAVLISQMENLKWRQQRSTDETLSMLDESDDPTGGHYDTLAALRYAIVSYAPPAHESLIASLPQFQPEVDGDLGL